MRIQLRLAAILILIFVFSFFAGAPALVEAQAAAPSSEVPSSFQTKLLGITNSDRLAQGDALLTENSLLTLAAQKKADDMVAKGYFAHFSPLGVSPWYWITSVGYGYTHAGENLAINFDDPTAVEAAWMASPKHRANILRGLYTEMGIGIAHGTYQGEPVTFVVELFATPAPTKTNPA